MHMVLLIHPHYNQTTDSEVFKTILLPLITLITKFLTYNDLIKHCIHKKQEINEEHITCEIGKYTISFELTFQT